MLKVRILPPLPRLIMICKTTEDIVIKVDHTHMPLKKGSIIEIISGWSFMKGKLNDGRIFIMSEDDFRYRTEKLEFIEKKEFLC